MFLRFNLFLTFMVNLSFATDFLTYWKYLSVFKQK